MVNWEAAGKYRESAIGPPMDKLPDFLAVMLAEAGSGSMPVLLGLAGLVTVLLLSLIVMAGLGARRRAHAEAEATLARHGLETQLSELKGRLAAMAEMTSTRQIELTQTLNQRLDQVTQRLGEHLADTGQKLGQSLAESTSRTSDSLARLYERLALLDAAQANLSDLSTQVVSLKDVLANKQARGAFGQARMEAIIEDGLPRRSYEFQATLSNGKRPDCLIRLPGAPAALAIDAKFPLEGFEALRLAATPEAAAVASARVREAVGRHIDDIAAKYFIPGETQDMALLFVPSEAVFAELSERFTDLVQRAHRARIVIVSPNILVLAVQTMQAILKDVRMREQASVIQREVGLLMGDVSRLAERVKDLEKHFTLAAKDVEKILTSTEKLTQRGARIESVEVGEGAAVAPAPRQHAIAGA